MLIIDGHHCHTLNLKALRILNNAHIIAVSIPAHSSAYLQVHDVSIFGPFKRYFNSEMSEYIRLNSPKLKLRELAPIIEDPWYHASTKNIRAGFQKVGLWPLNPSWLEPKSKDLKILTVTSQEEKFYTLCNRALNEMSRHQLLSRLDALDIALPTKEELETEKKKFERQVSVHIDNVKCYHQKASKENKQKRI